MALSAEEKDRLEAAYQATTYRLILPGFSFDLRIGQMPPPDFERYLETVKVARCVFLTAANPCSEVQPEESNQLAQKRMRGSLRAAGESFLEGLAIPDSADWPEEPGFFVLNFDDYEAALLASEYNQNAFVSATLGERVRLIWV